MSSALTANELVSTFADWHGTGWSHGMKCCHAIGFLVVGYVMSLIPQLLPGSFAPGMVGAQGARDLWIGLMSWVQMGIGAGELTRRLLRGLGRIMRYDPAARRAAVRSWRPMVKRSKPASSAGIKRAVPSPAFQLRLES